MSAARTPFVELSEALRAVPRNFAAIEDALERLGTAVALDAHTISVLHRRDRDHAAFMASLGAYVARHKEPVPGTVQAPPPAPADTQAGHGPSNEEHTATVLPLHRPTPQPFAAAEPEGAE